MASEREIFDHALTISDARQRAEYLQQACGEDEALREHIETLPSIAANRHVEPKKLSTLVRGEYVFLANVLLQLGQYDDAARIAVKLAPAFPDRWEEQSAAAELLAECGALARDDASLALAERMSLSEGYFALAVVCEEAIGMVPAGSMEADAAVRPFVAPPVLVPGTSVGW